MYMPLDLILIYFFLIGIVTDLVSIQDPLFICERTAFDKLDCWIHVSVDTQSGWLVRTSR